MAYTAADQPSTTRFDTFEDGGANRGLLFDAQLGAAAMGELEAVDDLIAFACRGESEDLDAM